MNKLLAGVVVALSLAVAACTSNTEGNFQPKQCYGLVEVSTTNSLHKVNITGTLTDKFNRVSYFVPGRTLFTTNWVGEANFKEVICESK